METRRETLRIIGAIGSTCAFPFGANNLYGQHQHAHGSATQEPQAPYQPKFFTPSEYQTLARLTDVIIPPTDTPGASAAGVPAYIDYVVVHNSEHQKPMREGLAWLDRQSGGKQFIELSEQQQIAILQPLSEAIDRGPAKTAAERFFRMIKSMTADGYYTSQIGLVEELGYKGNTALPSFPGCQHPEHA
ncbi:MAG TPA: gluconate 2-dehydrogenase subunit 3 family protein [Bryobacteraceae bacterium]|nr:gluconate 2-dehydrogenase subunit 3 family protein [Bryobacteraceae bacterium]